MDKYGIIYKVVNNTDGKIYIGQTTKSLELRIKNHAKQGCYLYNAINKYGIVNFEYSIIETCDSKEELDEMEFHYIKQYNSLVPNGYNLTLGGEGWYGLNHSEKTKKQISDNLKIYYKTHPSASLGTKHTEEYRKRMSEMRKGTNVGEDNPFYGRKHTTGTRYKISQALLTTDKHPTRGKHLTAEWKEKLSMSNTGKIRSKECCLNISKSRMGKFSGPESKMSKKYVIESPEGELFFITGLYSFSKHYKNNLLDFRLLSAVAVGKRNHHKGYKCRFYDSELDRNIKEFIYHKDT